MIFISSTSLAEDLHSIVLSEHDQIPVKKALFWPLGSKGLF